MDLKIGHVYRFTFEAPFSPLGYSIATPQAGFYRLEAIYLYETLLFNGVDLVPSLYDKVGLGKPEYDAHRTAYAGSDFLQLKSVVDDSVIYMPSSAIEEIPIADVGKYAAIILGVKLGVAEDDTQFDAISALVHDLVEYVFGIDASVTLGAYDYSWLTNEEIAALKLARDTVKGNLAIRPTALEGTAFPVNLIAELATQRKENAALTARVAALEEIIITANGG